MKINKGNIIPFIKYLFKKKNGVDAPDQLLQSWSSIPEEDLTFHLKNMTAQWGWHEVQLQYEIEGFLQLAAQNQVAQQQQAQAQPVSNSSRPIPASTTNKQLPPIATKKSNKLKWIIALPILAVSAYIGIEYFNYQGLQNLYGVTDNIAIRNKDGKTVGRMDIFASSNAITSLRAVNSKIYNIIVDKDSNISESRKLLTSEATFADYLLQKEEMMVYINKNFLTENKEYFEIQKVVFQEINKSQFELNQLKSNIRKVIIGSLGQNETLKQLYIKNSCNNTSKEFTSILKHALKDNKTIIVICQLSNNQFYKLKGNPDENTYEMPVQVSFEVPVDSSIGTFTKGNYLFKKTGKDYNLFDCNKNNLNIKAKFDAQEDIIGFSYEAIPIVTPSPDVY